MRGPLQQAQCAPSCCSRQLKRAIAAAEQQYQHQQEGRRNCASGTSSRIMRVLLHGSRCRHMLHVKEVKGAPPTPTNTAHGMMAGTQIRSQPRAGLSAAAIHGRCTTGPLNALGPAREMQTRQGCMENTQESARLQAQAL